MIYPETIKLGETVKIEIKQGTDGRQYIYTNGQRFMQFDRSGRFESVPSAYTGGGSYGGGKFTGYLKPEPEFTTKMVQSSSDPNILYRLTLKRGYAIACTCPAYGFHGKCKHIDANNRGLTAPA